MADFGDQIVSDIKAKFAASEFRTKVVEPVNRKAIELTRRNTLDGKGLAGNEFTPYAPSTAKKKGHRAPVTFRETGDAMASLYGEPSQQKGEIHFADKPVIMGYHQRGEGRNPTREIFPESEQDNAAMEELHDFAAETLREYLQDG